MQSLKAKKELLGALVSRELKSRYKGSALGVLWSLLTPLFMAVIYSFFFRLLSGRAANTPSIIVGVFAWQYTAVSVQQGMGCVTNNGNLVKKVAFTRALLPLSTTVAAGVDYLISLVIQLGLVGFYLFQNGDTLTARFFILPLVFGLHSLFNLSLALLLGAMNVYFRDTRHLVGVLLSAFFFLSPAMYDLSFMESFARDMNPWITQLYSLNPLVGIFTAYRWAFLPGAEFHSTVWIWSGMALPVFLFFISCFVFRRAQRNFADFV
jgi:ABC-type polysaccharide/polyol phosphate export permease